MRNGIQTDFKKVFLIFFLILVLVIVSFLINTVDYSNLFNSKSSTIQFSKGELYLFIPKEIASDANMVYFKGNINSEIIFDDPLFKVFPKKDSDNVNFEVFLVGKNEPITSKVKTIYFPSEFKENINHIGENTINNLVFDVFLKGSDAKFQREVIDKSNSSESFLLNLNEFSSFKKKLVSFELLQSEIDLKKENLVFRILSSANFRGTISILKNGEIIEKNDLQIKLGDYIYSANITKAKEFFSEGDYYIVINDEKGFTLDSLKFKNKSDLLEINYNKFNSLFEKNRVINVGVNEGKKINSADFILNDQELFNGKEFIELDFENNDSAKNDVFLESSFQKVYFALHSLESIERNLVQFDENELKVINWYLENPIESSSDVLLRSESILFKKFGESSIYSLHEKGILFGRKLILNVVVDAQKLDYSKEYSVPIKLNLKKLFSSEKLSLMIQVTKPGLIIAAEGSGDEEILKKIASQKGWDYSLVPIYDYNIFSFSEELEFTQKINFSLSYSLVNSDKNRVFLNINFPEAFVYPILLSQNKAIILKAIDGNNLIFEVYSSDKGFFSEEIERTQIELDEDKGIFEYDGVNINQLSYAINSGLSQISNGYFLSYKPNVKEISDFPACKFFKDYISCISELNIVENNGSKKAVYTQIKYKLNENNFSRKEVKINYLYKDGINNEIFSKYFEDYKLTSTNLNAFVLMDNAIMYHKCNFFSFNNEKMICGLSDGKIIQSDSFVEFQDGLKVLITKVNNINILNTKTNEMKKIDIKLINPGSRVTDRMIFGVGVDSDLNYYVKISSENPDKSKNFLIYKINGVDNEKLPSLDESKNKAVNYNYYKEIIRQKYEENPFVYLLIIGSMEDIIGYFNIKKEDFAVDLDNMLIALDSYFYGNLGEDSVLDFDVGRIPFSDLSFSYDYFVRDLFNTADKKQDHFFYPDAPFYSSAFIPEAVIFPQSAKTNIFPKLYVSKGYSKKDYSSLADVNYYSLDYFNNENIKLFLIPKSKQQLIESFIKSKLIAFYSHGSEDSFVIDYSDVSNKEKTFNLKDIPKMNNAPNIIGTSCSTAIDFGKEFIKKGASIYLGSYDVGRISTTPSVFSNEMSFGNLLKEFLTLQFRKDYLSSNEKAYLIYGDPSIILSSEVKTNKSIVLNNNTVIINYPPIDFRKGIPTKTYSVEENEEFDGGESMYFFPQDAINNLIDSNYVELSFGDINSIFIPSKDSGTIFLPDAIYLDPSIIEKKFFQKYKDPPKGIILSKNSLFDISVNYVEGKFYENFDASVIVIPREGEFEKVVDWKKTVLDCNLITNNKKIALHKQEALSLGITLKEVLDNNLHKTNFSVVCGVS